jgi:inositol oxygenase
MHSTQTLDYVKKKNEYWCQFNHGEMSIMEALSKLNSFVDESDPDVDVPNSVHAYQTAEGIRKKHPDNEWLQVTGLIHDIGKVMALWGEPQFSTVGDTFPVGCRPDKSIVFDAELFKENPDLQNDKLNTKLGIYEENCGLSNVCMSWGHDEYLYRVLTAPINKCYLPEEALYCIRFHSFYPWHTSGAYMYLCNNKDLEMMKWVNEFNKFDLYSKCPDIPPLEELVPYYTKLVEKYIPGKLKW